MPTRQAGGFRKRPITHIGCEGDETPLICPPPPCNAIIAALSAGEGGVILDTTGSSGLFFDVHYNFNDGETEGDIGCEELSESYPLGEISQYFQETSPTIITLNVSQNECDTVACSTSFTINPEQVEVEIEGEDFIFTPTIPECDGEIAFVAMFEDGITDVVLDAETGQVTIPAQGTAGGIFVYYMTCNANVVAAFPLSITNPALGLRMVFNDIEDTQTGIADPTDVAQWNTFWNLPANGTPFASASVIGNVVILVGGGAMTIKASAFTNNTSLLEIDDQTGIVTALNNFCFSGCTSATTFTFPALTTMQSGCFTGCTSVTTFSFPLLVTITGTYCFQNCTSATTFTFPSLTTVGSECFRNCSAVATITMALCTSLGATVGDDNCFFSISGNTITVTVAASLETADSGSPDGDLVYLLTNNPGSTINYI